MRRATVWILAGTMILSVGSCSKGGGEPEAGAQAGAAAGTAMEPAVSAHAGNDLTWETSWDRAMERAREENKPVVVDFYADWCVWCKTLDSTTYKDPRVVEMLTSKAIPLKIDVDHGGRALARQHRVSGLPTILIVAPDGRELGRIPGYLPASDFLAEIQKHLG